MINFAHRGDSGNYPENTLLSIRKGLECGATGIEIDVHKSKDGKLVVIHDEDIGRTFIGEGLVKDFSLNKLKTFKNRNTNFHDEDCTIPTLEEVILLIKDSSAVLNIELKTDQIHYEGIEKDVIAMIKKHGIEKRVILSSFNHDSIKIAKEIDKDIKVGVLYSKPIENVIDYAKKLGADAIHPCGTLVTKELIEEAHKNNLMINIYTVNEIKDMKTLISLNVDGVFTDFPKRLVDLLR